MIPGVEKFLVIHVQIIYSCLQNLFSSLVDPVLVSKDIRILNAFGLWLEGV